uniref:Uncharacterized protein n=1 Tax=Cynoglossus semilaevis TaxID=244447 RepID=A0A3P8VSS3_CYNSE
LGSFCPSTVEPELDILSCFICLDVVNDPVTIPCGHSYCMKCIIAHWDCEDGKTHYSCPQCEKTFSQRPIPVKSNMLADLVKELKRTRPKAAAAAEVAACDVCDQRKHLCTCHPSPSVQYKNHTVSEINMTVLEPKTDKPVEHSQTSVTEQVPEMPYPHHAGISQQRPEQEIPSFPSVSVTVSSAQSSSLNIFQDITGVVYQKKTVVQDMESAVPQPVPQTRAEFLKYSQVMALDPNTAHTRLFLSNGNRKVTVMTEDQTCSHHPERFTNWCQVLSTESLIGRCYWEVEWRGRKVGVAVSSKGIQRVGGSAECGFGFNENSWALDSGPNSCTFYYNNVSTKLFRSVPSRVGVFLDHSAGVLAFYGITDTMALLHRVQTTFCGVLHAGVRFIYHSPGSTAEFCKL